MRLETHTAGDFAQAMRELLPPGEAWQWPADGLGAALTDLPAQELARVDAQAQQILDAAVLAHTPRGRAWRLRDYLAVAAASQEGVRERVPRASFAVGSVAGQRLWSDARAFAAGSAAGQALWSPARAGFPVATHRVEECRPFAAGSPAGARVWSERGRSVLLVGYYATVADLPGLRGALRDFRQAHVALFFVDITGSGGEIADAQH